MFQTIIKRVVPSSNNNITGALQFLRLNSTTLENHTRRKEFQKVKLIGTIYQNPFTFDDGAKVVTVKTVASDNIYKVHRALVKSEKILSILGNSLSEGQRVYISGNLQATNYLNDQNKNRQQLSVRVNEMYVSKADTSTGENAKIDENHVSILSHIASEINHLDTFSTFKLVSHHISRNAAEGPIEKPSFYSVFVHNSELIKLLKNELQRRDRVIVEGFLNSKPETDQNGVKRYAGYIEATNIFRVDRFSEAINESIQSKNE